MSIVIKAPSGGGSISLDTQQSVTGDHTLQLPTGVGSAGQVLKNSSTAGTLEFGTPANTFGFTSLGETATTSGNGHTVSGIPSDATEVIVMLSDVSVNSTTTPHLLLGLGNGSIDTGANYKWTVSYGGANNQVGTGQSSIRLTHTAYSGAANIYHGFVRINLGTSNIQGIFDIYYQQGQGPHGLFVYSGTTIDRLQLSTSSTFDAGKFEVFHNGTP